MRTRATLVRTRVPVSIPDRASLIHVCGTVCERLPDLVDPNDREAARQLAYILGGVVDATVSISDEPLGPLTTPSGAAP